MPHRPGCDPDSLPKMAQMAQIPKDTKEGLRTWGAFLLTAGAAGHGDSLCPGLSQTSPKGCCAGPSCLALTSIARCGSGGPWVRLGPA